MGCNCKKTAGRLLDGAKGITKAVFGFDRAAPGLIRDRRAICNECPHAVPCRGDAESACWCGKLWDGVRGLSPTCGCNIPLKTRLKGESCPLDAW